MIQGNWHYGRQPNQNIRTSREPEYAGGMEGGRLTPPITSFGNIQFLDAMDMIKAVWEDAHPEISFHPQGDHMLNDLETAYIIYSTAERVTKENNPKPRFQWRADTDSGERYAILSQSFIHRVKFRVVHKSPRVAEEVLDEFEDFMMLLTPLLKQAGMEDIYYLRRTSDNHLVRAGEDKEDRGVIYTMTFQKILLAHEQVLDHIYLKLHTAIEGGTPSTIEVTLPDNDE